MAQKPQIFRSQTGQIVVEYVLLLSIAVTLAMVIISALVKRGDDADNSGALISKWRQMQEAIANDTQN